MNDETQIKVCFETQRAYPLFNPAVDSVFGGAEVDLYYLATELAKDRDFVVTFVVGDYGQPDVECREGVTLIKSINVERNFLLGGGRFWGALQRADADIYLRKGLSLGAALMAMFCKRNGRVFVARTSNSSECDGSHFKQHRLRARALRWALKQAAAVLVLNDVDAANLKASTGITGQVIRNGHPLPAVLPEDQRETVLWVGRSAAVKAPHRFLDLAEQFPQQSFTMICPRAVDDDSYDQLSARAKAIGNVDFISAVPFHQIDSYFQRAIVFVNTSDKEGFPNTFIQACKGRAAILSFTVNPDDFLNAYNCGLCSGGDEQRLADNLKQLLGPVGAVDYGANGRRYVEQNHDIKMIIREYKTLFRRLRGIPTP